MTKEELWAIYCKQQPKFADDQANITFSHLGLLKFFNNTWEYAHAQGLANGKAIRDLEKENEKTPDKDMTKNLFNNLFGGK